MKKLAVLFLSLFVFAACKDNEVEEPENLLSEDRMAQILYDISLLQAMNSYAPATLDANDIVFKDYIYQKYEIDSATFAQNHKYYASRLEEYKRINDKVKQRLKAEKIVIDSLVKKEEKAGGNLIKPKPDSLRNSRIKAVQDKLKK